VQKLHYTFPRIKDEAKHSTYALRAAQNASEVPAAQRLQLKSSPRSTKTHWLTPF
jgi:hypothetical protein